MQCVLYFWQEKLYSKWPRGGLRYFARKLFKWNETCSIALLPALVRACAEKEAKLNTFRVGFQFKFLLSIFLKWPLVFTTKYSRAKIWQNLAKATERMKLKNASYVEEKLAKLFFLQTLCQCKDENIQMTKTNSGWQFCGRRRGEGDEDHSPLWVTMADDVHIKSWRFLTYYLISQCTAVMW